MFSFHWCFVFFGGGDAHSFCAYSLHLLKKLEIFRWNPTMVKIWSVAFEKLAQSRCYLWTTIAILNKYFEGESKVQLKDWRNNLMVCKQVHETVHHIFNSWFWSAPVIRNLQNGTLLKETEWLCKWNSNRFICVDMQFAHSNHDLCLLTQGPAFCGCHRREGRKGDGHHVDEVHADI